MKTFILTLALLVASSSTAAQSIPPDKVQHIAFSAVVGIATANVWPDNKLKAISVAMIPGVIKEISDAQPGGTGFSKADLVADLIGATIGVYTTSWLISHSKQTTTVSYSIVWK